MSMWLQYVGQRKEPLRMAYPQQPPTGDLLHFSRINVSCIHSFRSCSNNWNGGCCTQEGICLIWLFSFLFVNRWNDLFCMVFQVVALYPFQAIESGDISLEKVFTLLDSFFRFLSRPLLIENLQRIHKIRLFFFLKTSRIVKVFEKNRINRKI